MTTCRACLYVLVPPLLLIACNDTPTKPTPTPLFNAAQNPNVVTTLAELQQAVADVREGGIIRIQGTIEIPGGEEVYLEAPGVTIEAATPGAGLRSVPNGSGDGPVCLICLASTADGATVRKLTLDGSSLTTVENSFTILAEGTASDPIEGVIIHSNRVVCAPPCEVHVFLWHAPGAVFKDNTLFGRPEFSAIQVQELTGATVKNNWVAYGGVGGGIRIRSATDVRVEDNVVASATHNAIIFNGSTGGTIKHNKLLAITDPGAASCKDFSVGDGTAGTANTWEDNEAPVPSSPVGICGPVP